MVILVDEYDKPHAQALGNEELQDEYRDTLKAFYSVMKTQEQVHTLRTADRRD